MSEQNLMESTDHGTTGVVPPVKRNRGKGGKPQFGLTGASMLVVMIIAALYFLAPLWWFLVSATKSNGGLYSGNPFWFHDLAAKLHLLLASCRGGCRTDLGHGRVRAGQVPVPWARCGV